MSTTTISGTTDVEDNAIIQLGPAQNYGGATGSNDFTINNQGSGNNYRELLRVATAAIPSGTLTDFRLKAYTRSWGAAYSGENGQFFIVKDANNWVEGTGAGGSPQVGSSCWDYTQYNTVAWAGSAGGSTSGTDYDADATPPLLWFRSHTAAAWETATLDVAWAVAWKAATRVNNGIIGISTGTGAATTGGYAPTTEAASNQPYFEIDWVAGIAASVLRPFAFSPRSVICR